MLWLLQLQLIGKKLLFPKLPKRLRIISIVILGGGKAKSPIDLLQQVYDSVQAGGAGVAMGRNVWRQPEPEKITRAICRILHENATVEEAAKEL